MPINYLIFRGHPTHAVSKGSQKIQIIPDTITVPGIIVCGRLLPIPAVKYENTGAQPDNAPWNMKDKRLCKTAPSSLAWTILKLGGATMPEEREAIIRKALKSYGLKMREPSFGPSFRSIKSQGSAFEKELSTFFEDSAREKIKLMLVVLPKKNDRYYARVKYCGDFIHGMLPPLVLALLYWRVLKTFSRNPNYMRPGISAGVL